MSESTKGRGISASLPLRAVLVGALAIGLAGNLLLRPAGGPGLNLLLFFVLLAVAVGMVTRRAGLSLSGEASAWIATGLLFATAFILRASPVLHLLAFLTASAAFALPALRSGAAWFARSGVSDHVEAVGGAIVHSALGGFRLVVQRQQGEHNRTAGAPSGRRGWAVFRGFLLALPLLLVFSALFVSADPVFASMASSLVGAMDLEELASHLVLIGILTWLAAGYLSGFVTGTRIRGWIEPVASRPSMGILEVGTALALVDLLFLTFVVVQLRYLFGGSGLVEVTPGLTYAEYAREGFAQLVVAAVLVLPLLLASDWLLRREGHRDEWIFRTLGGLQLLLLLLVIASAFQRVRVYQEAYGLTEPRFYGTAFLIWLVLLSLWFASTVLRSRRDRFAPVALVSGYVMVAGLMVVNPDAQIARANLARATELDVEYLGSLSADAAPVLVGALAELPAEVRSSLTAELHERWGSEVTRDWRRWNGPEARARRLVQQGAPRDRLGER